MPRKKRKPKPDVAAAADGARAEGVGRGSRVTAAPMTIGGYIRFVWDEFAPDSEIPPWPPDAFAIAAGLLRRADAYCRALDPKFPPHGPEQWTKLCRRLGSAWADAASRGTAPPAEVQDWWRVVAGAAGRPMDEVQSDRRLFEALLGIVAAADEACDGVGDFFGGEGERVSRFRAEVGKLMGRMDFRSICRRIHPSRACVLPKEHTPSIGMTLRSLTHHIALIPPAPVVARWRPAVGEVRTTINLLLVPWPERVKPHQFRAVESADLAGHMDPRHFRYFTFDPAASRVSLGEVELLVEKARSDVIGRDGRLDAVLFPEASLRPDDPDRLAVGLNTMIIGGIGAPAHGSELGTNSACVRIPLSGASSAPATAADLYIYGADQAKHHRWQLDEYQIMNYGIGARLDPRTRWWECIPVGQRELNFWGVFSRFSLAVLICEDLARQDPMADVVRAVGPDLVVALLQDGPQLDRRWSARYATILADDPGSSVLTMTSIGMAELSRPSGAAVSRVVALWKDAGGPARELVLPVGSKGLVITLSRRPRPEWTADGRIYEDSGYYALTGVHPV
jgi:hypothetical protein